MSELRGSVNSGLGGQPVTRRFSPAQREVKSPRPSKAERFGGGPLSDILVYLTRTARFGERNQSRKLAMIALCNAASDSGEALAEVVSAADIAEAAELKSVKNGMRVRSELVALGLLDVVSEPGRGRGSRGEYRINVERLKALTAGEWDYEAEAAAWRAREKGAVTAPKDRVPSQHPNEAEKGAALGAAKGAALGAAKGATMGAAMGATTPHTPLRESLDSLPLPPHGGSESEREEHFEEVLSALRAKCPDATRAIDKLIDPLLRFREYRAPDKVFSLSQIANWAERHGDDVLADAKRRAMKARDRVLDPAVIEKALEAAIAEHRKTEHLRPAQSALDHADADVLAQGREVCKLLQARLGDDVFRGWFSSIVFERACTQEGAPTVTASVGEKFIKTYIEGNYADALQHCAARVFGHGTRVVLSERAGRAA